MMGPGTEVPPDLTQDTQKMFYHHPQSSENSSHLTYRQKSTIKTFNNLFIKKPPVYFYPWEFN